MVINAIYLLSYLLCFETVVHNISRDLFHTQHTSV